MTLLGFELPPDDTDPAVFHEHLEDLLAGLGTVLMVRISAAVRLEA